MMEWKEAIRRAIDQVEKATGTEWCVDLREGYAVPVGENRYVCWDNVTDAEGPYLLNIREGARVIQCADRDSLVRRTIGILGCIDRITISFQPGVWLPNAVREALNVAKRVHRTVTFSFNDTEVECGPGDDSAAVLDRYSAQRAADQAARAEGRS